MKSRSSPVSEWMRSDAHGRLCPAVNMFQLVIVGIVLICFQFTTGGPMKENIDDEMIQYPGPVKGGDDDIPAECRHLTYCTVKPKNYPQAEFDKLLNGTTLVLPNLIIPELDEIPNRQGYDSQFDSDCKSTVTYEPLYRVRRKKGDWRLVINSEDKNYMQKVRLETCSSPGGRCFTWYPEIPGITTFCRQALNDWQFVVSDDKGGMETFHTQIPVCCSCHYKSVEKK